MTTQADSSDQSGTNRWVPLTIIGIYLVGLTIMALAGHYAFIWKIAIVPALLVAALLTKRARQFVVDWAVFLSALVLFDTIRGAIYSLTTYFQLPVYMNYAIEWERAIVGRVAPVAMQQAFYEPPLPGPWEKFLVVVHGSHFVFFLLFALLVWLWRHAEFDRFKLAILSCFGAGLVIYFAVPTVPPWMAANVYHVLPEIHPIRATVYSFAIPTLQEAFDTNPIAAMPSLHTAFPALLVLAAWRHFRWWAIPVLIYFLAVITSLLHLGEHYVVDILAGLLLSIAAYAFAYHLVPRLRRRPTSGSPSRQASIRKAALLSLLVIVSAEALGRASVALRRPPVVSDRFVQRELVGKSPIGDYYQGMRTFEAKQFAAAKTHFGQALATLPSSSGYARRSHLMLARAASQLKDYAAAVDNFKVIPRQYLDLGDLLMLGIAHIRLGQRQEGLDLLRFAQQRHPGDPEPLFWHTWFARKAGLLSDAEVRAVLRRLGAFSRQSKTEYFRSKLSGLLAAPAHAPAPG